MTASVIIEEIKAVPPEERAKVIGVLEVVKAVRAVCTMRPGTFEESTQRMFDRHAEWMHGIIRIRMSPKSNGHRSSRF